MRKWAAGSAAFVALALFPGEGFADYWYCQFTPYRNPNLAYFSDTFGPFGNGASGNASTLQEIRRAFADFVAGKYAETGTTGCAYFPDQKSAEEEKKRSQDLLAGKSNNGRAVATFWRYTGSR